MKVGIDPRRSSSVCNFTAALVEQNGAHFFNARVPTDNPFALAASPSSGPYRAPWE